MNKLKYLLISGIMTLVVVSCQSKERKNPITNVEYSGALKAIMSGNIKSVISLDSLKDKKNLYALGAVEHLKGEIQIFDSKPSNSFVVDSSLQIKESFNLNAALLIYAEVPAWDSFQILTIKTKSDLEVMIFETAKSKGVNVEKPFPFLLEGTVESLDWHVINWKKSDTIHNHKKHKDSGLNGTLKNTDVEILGFYSTKHKAIFTHHTTNMHMHFKTVANTIAGHIDDLMLNENMILKLPKQ